MKTQSIAIAIVSIISTLLAGPAFAANPLDKDIAEISALQNEDGTLKGSLSSREQTDELIEVVKFSLNNEGKIPSFDRINAKLKEMKLPEIDVSASPPVIPAKMSGFDHSELIGASIDDGKHLYCLPCSTNVWNTYVDGVVTSPYWYERFFLKYW